VAPHRGGGARRAHDAGVTRSHERYYRPLLGRLGAEHVVVQPDNRGTVAGILYPLLRLAALGPEASVALFPSDHHFSDEARFMAHVNGAFDALEIHRDRVLLLGIAPDTHETEYGWIEPGDYLPGRGHSGLYAVRRFWEKPDPALAEMLRDRGCYWNSFVIVARVSALIGLVRSALPELFDALAPVSAVLGADDEAEAVEQIYRRLRSADFSREVLSARPGRLGLLPVGGVVWSDLGSPERVLMTRRRIAGPSTERELTVA
jgi:mannose-1-phosphate guanylyltransferase